MLLTPPPSWGPQSKGEPLRTDDHIGQVLPGTSIEFRGVLGNGAYGTVYKAQDLSTGMDYAVKVLGKIGLSTRQSSFLEQEIRLHRRASSHPNVVTLVDVVDTRDAIYVILEYCPEGDLFSNIIEKSRYMGNDFLAKRIFLQLLDAVEYCHSIGVYHRDIKPENILITDGGMTAKLADFGLACTDRCSSDFGCGSTFYMSPECLQPPMAFSCYSSAANDVWALGICLINLTCGRNPWKRASVQDPTFTAYLQDSAFLPTILPLSHDLDWVLRRIFECEPTKRICIAELRDLIHTCRSFTTNRSVQCASSVRRLSAETRNLFSTRAAVESHYDPQDYTSHYPHQQCFPASPGSAASDDEWLDPRSASPLSSSSPSSGFTSDANPAETASHVVLEQQETYASYPSTAWYSTFMLPAFDLAQKHLSFHPTLSMRFT